MSLRIHFSEPVHGWLVLEFCDADSTLALDCSAVPSDSVGDLARGLLSLVSSQLSGSVTVVLNHEPRETDLLLQQTANGRLSLVATAFSDRRRAARSGTVLLSLEGSRNDIALPIWRALRDLESRVPIQTYERSWGHPFPRAEVERLRSVIKCTPPGAA